MDVVNKLDEHELEKVSEMLRQSEKEALEAEGEVEGQEQEEGVRMVEVDENGDPIEPNEEDIDEVLSLPGDIAVSK